MPQMKLRVLFVEASEADLQQVLNKLADNEYLVEYLRVEQADTMRSALLEHPWDIVLCSYNPPAFGGLEALSLMQSLHLDIPFLFLSHNLREESIVQAIQAGAGDYIYKGSLNRLIPAIEHYMNEAAMRREHRRMLLELKENQARLQGLISNLPGMAYQLLQDETSAITLPYVSEGCSAMLGMPAQELQENPALLTDLIHPDDRMSYANAMHKSAAELAPVYWEGRINSDAPDGNKWVNLRCSPRKLPQGMQWECVMFDITERKQAEIEILSSQEQLRELSAHIQDVREQERLALAREVHDDMGSMLTAIKLDIAWIAGKLPNADAALLEKVRDIENLVGKCAAAASNISRNLRPSALDSFGIVAAVEIEVHEFEQRTGIPCILDTIDEGDIVSPNIAITLFRILQETLNNIMKHAQAGEVRVTIYNRKNIVSLSVNDNGRGLSSQDRLKPRSFGLRGIQERVARFGGEVSISSKPGKGTTVAVRIPHSDATETQNQTHQQTLF